MNILIKAIVKTLLTITYFSLLLFLFIFIFALLGMEQFAYKIRTLDDLTPTEYIDIKGYSPMLNFDNIINAMITVFCLVVNEDWN